jgi:Flp pilus assembly protein TadG
VHPRVLSRSPFSVRSSVRRSSGPESGQSLVEFSLVLMPLFLILLGIIQFGFIFNSYVTMTNAARDAARLGTVYVYDASTSPVTMTKALNDQLRNNTIKNQVIASMNVLGTTSPHFSTSGAWTKSGTAAHTIYTNGDLVITYDIPDGTNGDPVVTDTDPRSGERITVSATYHQDLVIPLIAALLPKDANGRMGLTGVVTMVIN